MQTFQIEVEDSIVDKILWFLNNSDVIVKDIENNNIEYISSSIKNALEEVKEAKKYNKKLDNAWDILDEL
jgi:hypothetical protein